MERDKTTDSVDVTIMKTVAQFDYLIKRNEQITIEELKARALNVPAIMDEPDLQIMVQIIKDSTIKTIYKNSMGLWYNFKNY